MLEYRSVGFVGRPRLAACASECAYAPRDYYYGSSIIVRHGCEANYYAASEVSIASSGGVVGAGQLAAVRAGTRLSAAFTGWPCELTEKERTILKYDFTIKFYNKSPAHVARSGPRVVFLA